jgi:IclR family acetate operon transcriptional repressor
MLAPTWEGFGGRSRAGRMKEPKKDKYFARAIAKALHVLEIFRQSPEPLSLNQVTTKIRSAKSSVFRILHTLEVLGYLEPAGGDRYRLSPTAASVVPNQLHRRLLQAATPRMRELGREFRETVSLAFLFESHIEVICVVESPQKIQMGNIVGSIIPPHASSLGKSIIAGQPEWRREKLLRAYGIYPLSPHTITDEVKLKEELDLVRTRGYAADMEETTPGGCCFGVPILGDHGCPVAALSISLPKVRLEKPERIISALRSTAAAIMKDLSVF